MRDILEGFVLLVVIPFVVVMFGLGVLVALVELHADYECSNYQRITGIETKRKTLDQCYVKTSSGWQRWDEYQARSVTNEGRAKGGAE